MATNQTATREETSRPTGYDLYYAAVDADDRFTAELVRVYGRQNAGEARYYANHADARVVAALEAKRAADKAWFSSQRGREVTP